MSFPRTPEELLPLAYADPEWLEIAKDQHIYPPSLDNVSSVDFIKALRASSARYRSPADADIKETAITIPARDGHLLHTLVWESVNRDRSAPMPLVVLYHGGGYCIGDPRGTFQAAVLVLKNMPAVVVSPAYRLAPEFVFPQAVEDAEDTLRWIAENAATEPAISASPSLGFVVGGVSAGAGLSNTISRLAKDKPLAHPLTGIWLACGSGCPPEVVPEQYKGRYLSRTQEEVKQDKLLTPKALAAFVECYKPDPSSPLSSSFAWPTGHSGLPPMYQQVCGMEYSRDDSLITADHLHSEAGVKVRVDLYSGLPHCFWGMWTDIAQAKQWRKDTVEGFRWLLQTPRDSADFARGERLQISSANGVRVAPY